MKTDQQLKKDVEAELEWDPAVHSARIGVTVQDGIVTLSGSVADLAEKAEIERAARRVEGVQAIAMEVQVSLPTDHIRTDADIARAVENALKWHTQLPANRIQVKVERGLVTLSGEVDWDYQRRSAESAVHLLTGVVGVVNLISIKAKPTPANISERIRSALERQAEREARAIEVSVTGSTTTLRGTVHSWYEWAAAQGAAWSAPGITSVRNELRVSR